MAFVINQVPWLHKHIGNNVYTTSHKNLIKILTARTETTCRLSQNGSNYKTPRVEKNRTVDLDFGFLHETGAKTAIRERLITKSFGRIGCFALSFNCEVKFNLARRGRKCAKADGRQLPLLWDQLNCENGYYEITQLYSFREKRVASEFLLFLQVPLV